MALRWHVATAASTAIGVIGAVLHIFAGGDMAEAPIAQPNLPSLPSPALNLPSCEAAEYSAITDSSANSTLELHECAVVPDFLGASKSSQATGGFDLALFFFLSLAMWVGIVAFSNISHRLRQLSVLAQDRLAGALGPQGLRLLSFLSKILQWWQLSSVAADGLAEQLPGLAPWSGVLTGIFLTIGLFYSCFSGTHDSRLQLLGSLQQLKDSNSKLKRQNNLWNQEYSSLRFANISNESRLKNLKERDTEQVTELHELRQAHRQDEYARRYLEKDHARNSRLDELQDQIQRSTKRIRYRRKSDGKFHPMVIRGNPNEIKPLKDEYVKLCEQVSGHREVYWHKKAQDLKAQILLAHQIDAAILMQTQSDEYDRAWTAFVEHFAKPLQLQAEIECLRKQLAEAQKDSDDRELATTKQIAELETTAQDMNTKLEKTSAALQKSEAKIKEAKACTSKLEEQCENWQVLLASANEELEDEKREPSRLILERTDVQSYKTKIANAQQALQAFDADANLNDADKRSELYAKLCAEHQNLSKYCQEALDQNRNPVAQYWFDTTVGRNQAITYMQTFWCKYWTSLGLSDHDAQAIVSTMSPPDREQLLLLLQDAVRQDAAHEQEHFTIVSNNDAFIDHADGISTACNDREAVSPTKKLELPNSELHTDPRNNQDGANGLDGSGSKASNGLGTSGTGQNPGNSQTSRPKLTPKLRIPKSLAEQPKVQLPHAESSAGHKGDNSDDALFDISMPPEILQALQPKLTQESRKAGSPDQPSELPSVTSVQDAPAKTGSLAAANETAPTMPVKEDSAQPVEESAVDAAESRETSSTQVEAPETRSPAKAAENMPSTSTASSSSQAVGESNPSKAEETPATPSTISSKHFSLDEEGVEAATAQAIEKFAGPPGDSQSSKTRYKVRRSWCRTAIEDPHAVLQKQVPAVPLAKGTERNKAQKAGAEIKFQQKVARWILGEKEVTGDDDESLDD